MENVNPLGRRKPTTDEHIRKHPLLLSNAPSKPVPVATGTNWYTNFDTPVQDKDGKWWVGRGNLGTIRGGHCVCMPHRIKLDLKAWYAYYNQLKEGACVGMGCSRMMSLLNRKRYDAFWLWNEAKKIDEWSDTNAGDNNGTSVRAAMDVLRMQGHVKRTKTRIAKIGEGIEANKWATNIDDLFSVLQNDTYKKLGAIPFLNSWGETYPQVVWMPCETWDRLIKEDGEMTLIVDRP